MPKMPKKDRIGPENMKIELGKVEEKPGTARQPDTSYHNMHI